MSIQLTHEQYGKLLLALCAAFPSRAELEKMVYFNLGEVLNLIIPVNETLGTQIFELIKWAHSRGRVADLIAGACAANPNNPLLKEFARQVTPEARPTPTDPPAPAIREYRFPEVWKFDLSVVWECVGHIEKQEALCGFTLGCDVDAFRESFCKRLVHASGRGRVDIIADRFTVTQKDTVDIIQKYASEIERLKDKLQNRDLLCVVKLQSYDKRKVGERARELWSALQEKFQGSYNHRLIIVLFSWVDFTPPQGMIRLDPPRFNIGHLSEWIQDVAPAIGWEQRFLMDWRNYIITNSELENNDGLSVERTYWYLARSLELLSKRPPPSPAEFLAELY